MDRPTDSNACHRCPDHGAIRVDGPVTLKLCRRCWIEWQTSVIRGQVHASVRGFLARGHDEAAPRQLREEAEP